MNVARIILASGSIYRRQLLAQLKLPFRWVAPDIDERPRHNEPPHRLVERLALEKAKAIARHHPKEPLVIGSDQIAMLGGEVLGKPGARDRNITQLLQCSGRRVEFWTGIALLNHPTGHTQVDVVPFSVIFRSLTPDQIEHYVDLEKPFDCAGGFRLEGLGISLFERLLGEDPSALIGLPLIRLIEMLKHEGFDVLENAQETF